MNIKEECFEQIYEVMEMELVQKGEKMPCTKNVFLLYQTSRIYEADYLKIKNLNNFDFFQAVYLLLFNRVPDEDAKIHWREKMETLENSEFQKQVLNSVRGSQEYVIKGSKLINYCLAEEDTKDNEAKLSRKVRILNRLYPIYAKLPERVKDFMRKHIKKYVSKI